MKVDFPSGVNKKKRPSRTLSTIRGSPCSFVAKIKLHFNFGRVINYVYRKKTRKMLRLTLVWEMENRTIAVEAKSKLKREVIPVSLKSFIEKYNLGKIFIVNDSLLEKRGNVVFLPYYLLSILFRMLTGDAY